MSSEYNINQAQVEMSIIGAILRFGEKQMSKIVDIITGDDFTQSWHGAVFDAAMTLYGSGKPIDLITVHEELRENGTLAQAGGESALMTAIEHVITPQNLVFHAKIVRKAANERRARLEIIRLKQSIENGTVEESQVEAVRSAIDNMGVASSEGFKAAETVHEALYETVPDLSWGWDVINGITEGGVRRKEVSVLAGRPGNGKTTVMVNVAMRNLDQGKRVFIASLEMPKMRLMQKIIAMRTGKSVKEMDEPYKEKVEKSMVGLFEEEWGGRCTIVDAEDGVSNAFSALRAARGESWDLLLIDYIQFGLYADSIRLDVTRAMNQCKRIATDKNGAVMVAAQLNRASLGRQDGDIRPRISELKESGGIEEFACDIVLLHYPSRILPGIYDPEQYQMIVGKSRYGSTGEADFFFNGKLGIIRSIDEMSAPAGVSTPSLNGQALEPSGIPA